MNEKSIRNWYQETTKKSIKALLWASAFSLIGAIAFYVLAPATVHLKLQIFNGAITIPVAGLIWIVSFILLWLVPMRETAFRSQESMERMEARFEKRLQNVDKVIDRLDRISKEVEDGTHPLLNRLEDHALAIRRRIERDTEPLKAPQRRDRSVEADPVPITPEEIQEMEDRVDAGIKSSEIK